jgi:hypothetical protein
LELTLIVANKESLKKRNQEPTITNKESRKQRELQELDRIKRTSQQKEKRHFDIFQLKAPLYDKKLKPLNNYSF